MILLMAKAQDADKLPALNTIRTPNAPAFSILGVQPTSVERPNSPADLTMAIDNSTEGFTEFPQNFAVEFSPYWMSKAPASLTWRNDIKRDVAQSLTRTLSASFATITKEVNAKEIRGLSYGARAMLFSGKMSDKSVEAIESLEEKLKSFSVSFADTFKDQEKEETAAFFRQLDPALPAEEKQKRFLEFNQALQARREKNLKETEEKFKEEAGEDKDDFAPQREGFVLEVAFASAYRTDTVSTELKKSGWAWWVTPSYVMGDYSVVGVFRQLKDSLENKSTEYGVRFLYSKERYALSLEYLKGSYETETQLPNRERFSMLFEYLLNEKFWLTLSFGEDNKNIQGIGSVFSAIGIRYNFSKERFAFE